MLIALFFQGQVTNPPSSRGEMAATGGETAATVEEKNYSSILSCIAGPGVRLDTGRGALYKGCRCKAGENCVSFECSCAHAHDAGGRLREEYFSAASKPVFECNSHCKCASTCPNRATQNPPLSKLQVFETGQKAKGYGVKTLTSIAKGTFVAEYVGEIVSTADAKRRLEKLSSTDSCYIVMYREHTSSGTVLTTSVDAAYAGNTARFVNHSCSPNLSMVPVRVDSLVPKLCLFACKDVAAREELCFSYFGCSSADLADRDAVQLGRKACLCGSKDCLQFLPLQN